MTGYKKPTLPFAVGEILRFKSNKAARRCVEGLTKRDELEVVKTGISVIRCKLPSGAQVLIDSWEFNELERATDLSIKRDELFLLTMIEFSLATNDEQLFMELTDELKALKEGKQTNGGATNDI